MARYFVLPIITELTYDQQLAIDETRPLALSGGPGTGKSVICLFRHIRNCDIGKKTSLLLTYTKTLEHYFKESVTGFNNKAYTNIDRTYWWLTHNATHYDEIIVDEAQDVSIDNYNKIKTYSDCISYGADDKQRLYDHGCGENELARMFPENIPYTLNMNFRNSKEIIEFTRSVFINTFISQNAIDKKNTLGKKPILKITNGDINIELDVIMDVIHDNPEETHSIGILVAGEKSVGKYHKLISGRLDNPIECTKYENNMPDFEGMERIHVTTFKSSKGTEFDTVIIPGFDSINWMIQCSKTISDKDYYVAFTRAKRNLILLCKKRPIKGDKTKFEIE